MSQPEDRQTAVDQTAGLPMAGLLADLLDGWDQPEGSLAAPIPVGNAVDAGPADPDDSQPHAEPGTDPLMAPQPPAQAPVVFRLKRRIDAGLVELIQAMHAPFYQAARSSAPKHAGQAHLTFHLCGERLAFRLEQVQLVERVPACARVSGLAPPVAGLANVRGNVIPLVDLRRWWPGAKEAPSSDGRMIVVRPADPAWTTALIVDGLGGVAWLESGERQHAGHPAVQHAGHFAVRSAGHLWLDGFAASDGQPIGLVNLEKLLAAVEEAAAVH